MGRRVTPNEIRAVRNRLFKREAELRLEIRRGLSDLNSALKSAQVAAEKWEDAAVEECLERAADLEYDLFGDCDTIGSLDSESEGGPR